MDVESIITWSGGYNYLLIYNFMTAEDAIRLAIEEMIRVRDELKEYKKEKKAMEKNHPDDLKELLVMKEDLQKQIKEHEQKLLAELREDKDYKQVVQDIVLSEEKLSEAREKLFKEISTLKQNIPINMDIQVDDRLIKLQTEPTVSVYLNGREERKAK